ncbi:hypothetical protein LCGC14_0980810 [marine sediment metagenome]|uniref:Uncharacterized protein n=1 Tax=marine sediment metagenome TaxID=412755 RepID=A0A0F9RFD1_9ZZZZ
MPKKKKRPIKGMSDVQNLFDHLDGEYRKDMKKKWIEEKYKKHKGGGDTSENNREPKHRS